MLLALIKAPSNTIFATLIDPILSGKLTVGTANISMSCRAADVSTMEELTHIKPPDWRILWKRQKKLVHGHPKSGF